MSIELFVNHELETCKKALEAGNPGGLADALYLCRKWDVRPPQWVLEVSERVLASVLTSQSLRTREGENAIGWLERYRRDLVHYDRFETVERLLAHEPYDTEPPLTLSLNDDTINYLKEKRQGTYIRGRAPHLFAYVEVSSVTAAFRIAETKLRGTPAQVSEETIKRSYYLVKNEKNPFRFYISTALPKPDSAKKPSKSEVDDFCQHLIDGDFRVIER